MALPVTIPNQFANATSSIPLSQLDTNFNTLSNAVNGINSGAETLANLVATTANVTTGNITTVNATTVDTTNIEVTNVKAKDGTASATIADSTGVMTIASSVLTTTDINGGTLDNVVIGGANAAAITGTTITADTSVSTDTISEKTSAAGVTIDSVLLKDNKVTANELTINSNNISADNSLGFRNRIINGDMRIDQRNAGASVTPTTINFITDRWLAGATQASKFSIQQNAGSVTPPVGFTNYLGATSLSAYAVASGDAFYINQKIEGFNAADLAWGTANAKTVTLSFWVRSSLTGTFGGSVYNSAADRSYPYSYTISSANTWEQKSITIAGDTSGTWLTNNGTGITVLFSLGYGTSLSGTANTWAGTFYGAPTGATSVVGTNGATFYITGVQLEVGSVATPFERRPYGTEFMLCQRYYQAIGFPTSAGDVNTMSFKGYNATGEYDLFSLPLITQMRTDPTTTKVGTWAVTNCGQPSVTGQSQNSFSFQIQITSTGRYVATSNNSGYFTFSAEL